MWTMISSFLLQLFLVGLFHSIKESTGFTDLTSLRRHPERAIVNHVPTGTLFHAARSIATFDETDFTGPAGREDSWPYQASDLNRLDNSVDTNFYDQPRFVTHIDDGAIASLTKYYHNELTSLIMAKKERAGDGSSANAPLDVLDLCSSWISHLPNDQDILYGRVVGLGMNRPELEANQQLTEYVVQDLNQHPMMSQFEDESFDVVCNVVSVDYLIQPLPVFQEIHRILRPGGIALMSFSNRCFPTKAVAMWLQADDIGKLTIVASYFHYSAAWSTIEALDLKEVQELPQRPSAGDIFSNPALGLAWMTSASAVQKNNQGDPMYAVKGAK
jgi:SAM-dependent methyltransferase